VPRRRTSRGPAAAGARAPLPGFVPPQLATLVGQAPRGGGWLHEIKFDGYRTAARVAAGRVRMLTRRGLDWTVRFAPIARALARLAVRAAYIDGEIVVMDAEGRTSFAGLQDALSGGRPERLVYCAFDLLHLDGRDLRGQPALARKQALEALIAGAGPGPLRYSEHVLGSGADFLRHACRLRLEGVVAKLADAPYRPGRSRDWLKVKCLQRQEFVIGGWTASEAAGRELRSLLVGYFRRGRLVVAGKVGTGFDLKTGRELAVRLARLARRDPPFATVPAEYRRGIRWVEPRLVAEVSFSAWTAEGILRHASFEGIREDKPAASVVLETPVSAGP